MEKIPMKKRKDFLQQRAVKVKKIAKAVLPEKNSPYIGGGVSVFIIVVIVLEVMMFLLHIMIYETLVAAFGIGGWTLGVVITFLSLLFISASILVSMKTNWFIRLYYKLSAAWFAFIAPFCGACVAFVIIERVFPLWGWFVTPFLAGTVCFGAMALVALYGLWNGLTLRVTRITVPLASVPDFWKDRTIAFFSDNHLGPLWGRRSAAKVAKKVRAIDPAAVLMGGDLYDGMKCDTENVLEPFRDMHPELGMYLVTGNHEYIRDTRSFLDAIKNVGIHILDDEKVDLHGIDLIGVDFSDGEHREQFEKILRDLAIDPARPSILLKHEPKDIDLAEKAGISLTLCGHTHYGQFFPINLIVRSIYKSLAYGQSTLGKMTTYTTSGVGAWGSPFRLGTKSEIVVISFEKRH
jgi:predicted MPP superfamily phosphohydrolase